MEHHSLGMSRWTPWSVCPRFDSVDDAPSAKVGIEAHTKLNRILSGDTDVSLDETRQVDRAVAWAADSIQFIARESACHSHVHTEEKVTIGDDFPASLAGIYGTVDAFYHSIDENDKDVIHIFDFKSLSTGGKDMWAQLKGYALGVASKFGIKDWSTRVDLHLLLGGVFRHEFMSTTLAECITTGVTILDQRKHKLGIEPCPSSWCKYCKHASSCSATTGQVELVKSGGLMAYSAPKRLVIIDELEGILKKAKEEAKAEIALAPNRTIEDDGVAYAILTRNGPSKLAENKAIELFNACSQFGVSASDFLRACQLSKTDVIKLLANKGGLKQKSKNKDDVTAETVVAPFFVCKPVDKLERIK